MVDPMMRVLRWLAALPIGIVLMTGSAGFERVPQPAPPVAQPTPTPLDLRALEIRLRETDAIGVFSKLALKNQIEDLLERLRAFFEGRIETSLAELRLSYDLLLMKTLALLQDTDPALADAIASSRESIWSVLSDRAKLDSL